MKKLCLVLFCLCLLGSSALADNVKVLQKSDAELRQMGFLTAAEAEAQARRQLAEGAARGVYQVDFVDDAPDGMTAHCVLRAYDEDEYIWSVQLGRADDLPIYDIGIAAKGPDRGAVQYMNYHDRHSMQALVDRYRVSHGLAQAIFWPLEDQRAFWQELLALCPREQRVYGEIPLWAQTVLQTTPDVPSAEELSPQEAIEQARVYAGADAAALTGLHFYRQADGSAWYEVYFCKGTEAWYTVKATLRIDASTGEKINE